MSVIARKSVHLCCVWRQGQPEGGGGGGFIGDSWDIGRKGPWSYPGISPVNVPISSTFSRAMLSSAKGMRKNGFTKKCHAARKWHDNVPLPHEGNTKINICTWLKHKEKKGTPKICPPSPDRICQCPPAGPKIWQHHDYPDKKEERTRAIKDIRTYTQVRGT